MYLGKYHISLRCIQIVQIIFLYFNSLGLYSSDISIFTCLLWGSSVSQMNLFHRGHFCVRTVESLLHILWILSDIYVAAHASFMVLRWGKWRRIEIPVNIFAALIKSVTLRKRGQFKCLDHTLPAQIWNVFGVIPSISDLILDSPYISFAWTDLEEKAAIRKLE